MLHGSPGSPSEPIVLFWSRAIGGTALAVLCVKVPLIYRSVHSSTQIHTNSVMHSRSWDTALSDEVLRSQV